MADRGPIGGILLAATHQAENGKPVVRPTADADQIEEAVDILAGAPLDHLVVVMGEQAGTISFQIGPMPTTIKRHREWTTGMRAGVAAGRKSLPPDTEGALITTVDIPGITTKLVEEMMRRFRTGKGGYYAIQDGKRWRLPALVDLKHKKELTGLKDDQHLLDLLATKGDAVEGIRLPASP